MQGPIIIPTQRSVNGYNLLDVLGSGGTAIAYRAEKDGQQYCIREHRFGKRDDGRGEFKGIDLFQREYQVLKGLNHPQIPKVYDFFEMQEGRDLSLYMVQELAAGKCLESLLKQDGVFKEEEAVDIMLQVSKILEYIHSQVPAVIHRDVKPSNIMLDKTGKIYLIDFGIVQQKVLETIGGSTMFGTLGYGAPELFAGQAKTQSDIYSVGATLLKLVSGISPEQMMEGFNVNYADTVKFNNPSLDTLVGNLVLFDPKQRVQTAQELSNYLQQIKDGKQLKKKSNGVSAITRFFASLVPNNVLRHLAETRTAVVNEAKKGELLLTDGNKLENIEGDLRDAYKQIVPSTMRHVDELMAERRTNSSLRNLGFYTADGEVYSLDNGVPTLRITRGSVNPVLKNIDDAFEQLVNQYNYLVTSADFEAVVNAKDTVSIDLTQLELQAYNDTHQHLVIDTSKALAKYKPEQQKLLRRVYGPTDENYSANMQMLRTEKITETSIYVLALDYIKKHVENNPVGRASWLNHNRLRGVSRSS